MQNDTHLAALVVALDVRTVAQIAVFAIALALAIAALVITRSKSRALDSRELLAGAAVLVGLVALSTDTVLEPDSYDGRMRRELARHDIDVRAFCPPPAPGLSHTLTLIVDDQELAAAPRVETCFRVKVRDPSFMPAAAIAERTP